MTDRTLASAVDGFTFLEGPRWHDGRLWMSDFYTHKVVAVSPEGIVDETFGNRVSAFDIHDDGTLGPRRDWADFGPMPDTDSVDDLLAAASIGPDGNCLDAEGAVWVADAIHHRCVRVAEGGEVLEEISTGDDGVYACMLGGDDGRTLHLCVAPGFDETERRSARLGRLVTTTVDVPHAGTP